MISSVHVDSLHIASSDVALQSVWKNRLITVGKVGAGILCFSAIAASAGTLLQLGGHQLLAVKISQSTFQGAVHLAGNMLQQTGSGVFLAGKYAFLSVAVPTYAVGWVIPKWLITQAIPQTAMWSYHHVIVPLHHSIVQASIFLKKISILAMQKIYQSIIIPCAEWIKAIAIGTWSKVVQVSHFLYKMSVKVVQALYQNIIAPFMHGVKVAAVWTWSKVAQVSHFLYKTSVKVVQALYQKIIAPLIHAVKIAAVWTWSKVVQVSHFLYKTSVKVVQALYQNIIAPLMHAVKVAAVWTWSKVVQVSHFLYKMSVKVVQALYQNIIAPLIHAVKIAAVWTWSKVVQVSHFLYKMSVKVVQALYQNIIAPLQASLMQYKKEIIFLAERTKEETIRSIVVAYERVQRFLKIQPIQPR